MAKKKWAADHVERRKIADLVPYAKNSRTHSEEQIAQLCASIDEWGWTVPVLIDPKGEIIAGHGRVLAAERMGLEDVPCMVAEGWTRKQKRAYVIADNKLTENGGWNTDLLTEELSALKDLDFDLGIIGFDDNEIGDILGFGPDTDTDPDGIPAVQSDAVTQAGDIWILGNHRLRCGDSTNADDVASLLNGVKPHLMVTDPPYGVDYDPNWRNDAVRAGKSETDWSKRGRAVGVVQNDDRADWHETWSLFPGEVAYVWHGALHTGTVAKSLEQAGFEIRSQIIWAKNHIAISRGHYHWQHEPCWYAVRKSAKGHWSGDRKQSTLWEIDKPKKSETGHSTQKPVECMRRPIVNNSSPGQAVYEPFCGSGTTIIAGEMEGRHIYAMEIDPAYCDVIVRRWQEFTEQDAVLETTGALFSDVEGTRAKAA